jgi:hypothetical protein
MCGCVDNRCNKIATVIQMLMGWEVEMGNKCDFIRSCIEQSISHEAHYLIMAISVFSVFVALNFTFVST